jgi:RES domain
VSRQLRRVSIEAGHRLVRVVRIVHGRGGALFFGPAAGDLPTGRFDSPDGAFRVCYLADTVEAAFAESLLRLAAAPPTPAAPRFLHESTIRARAWAWTSARRALSLIDLSDGRGLAALNVTGALTAADAHAPARALSAQLHATLPFSDGLLYRTRHAPEHTAVALWDRAADALEAVAALEPLFADRSLLGRLLGAYQLTIDAS